MTHDVVERSNPGYTVPEGVVAASLPAGVATPQQSRVYPTDDGSWRAVWCGRAVDRSFPSRSAALAYNERCDRAGGLLP